MRENNANKWKRLQFRASTKTRTNKQHNTKGIRNKGHLGTALWPMKGGVNAFALSPYTAVDEYLFALPYIREISSAHLK